MNQQDYNFWKVLFIGQGGTNYYGGVWLMSVEFGSQYPSQSPEVRFLTPIYHCNVNDDGKICHQILSTNWSPSTNMKTIFEEIAGMMSNPNPRVSLFILLIPLKQKKKKNKKQKQKQKTKQKQKQNKNKNQKQKQKTKNKTKQK